MYPLRPIFALIRDGSEAKITNYLVPKGLHGVGAFFQLAESNMQCGAVLNSFWEGGGEKYGAVLFGKNREQPPRTVPAP